ncbi:hypothetical protein EDD33_1806 [Nocardioides aurantiacus]|uniref:Uncharacterized protein n=1 Tax=Nocardioides aurantiacus TaxID=86796 RepID=A0A3N2CTT3_9ACTN|nr:hypothetical protein EDD33_1806 [Nocardioides aurantiacus]
MSQSLTHRLTDCMPAQPVLRQRRLGSFFGMLLW